MQNKLVDLNNYLFEALERITDDELSPEDLDREIARAKAVTTVAETVIHNGELVLETHKHLAEYGLAGYEHVPQLLTGTDSDA